ncbi:nitrate/nitrite two-component system sensor histidine kinase NarQ [Rodentibacter trehalosifermentans]|uniref:Sensor protein n=1 Tax=Rodentibacter trehalosifermentans TaxID=1908263 RepID=A0A1V3IUJ7_9PAST|nr:nitrate/nitrite two-component system sensor histidine kinase NarQ [Rodentibacter trehalosifermentans]OOF45761.1 two-component system sensor histidine kinase NarQ [Rodentibacter trehalosifermentans]OOF49344.1 two-component system sensor histidine kinase NarQ [Rodentibacter trehalosifermentans]OOF51339.1 two-component system sensor histidine kinase NarQ [Rodentibacter trehalosifermentans]
MKTTRSVSLRIAKYLFLIIVVAGVISALSLAIITSNKSDAEAINVSGSLRMQSYRLLYLMEKQPDIVEKNLSFYEKSLHTPSLVEIQHQLFTPDVVKQSYQTILKRWAEMETFARQNNIRQYSQNLTDYVSEVDYFVFELQRFSEQKWFFALSVLCFSMLLIVGMVSYVIWFTRREVVKPLKLLTHASMQVQMRQFNHIPLDTENDNELGTLARVFTQMSAELGKLYSRLEEAVNEQTQKLRQTNHSLTTLYQSSQLLTVNAINETILSQLLNRIRMSEHLRYIELEVSGAEHWNIRFGEKQADQSLQVEELKIENETLGELLWQAGLPCPDPRMMQNLAQMLARALFFHKNQRQQEHLLLMEERSIIARELHDSLAQVLSFLQIQLTLLKHNLKKEDESAKQKSLAIITDFEQALSSGYAQLRELLATFRLTVQEANLQLALEQVIDSLRSQTTMKMVVNSRLPSQSLNPQQLVHVLQIVREAALNAIKHSKGQLIEINAYTNAEGEYEILIQDDGIGIPSLDEPAGHYGLNIMVERSRQLNAELTIHRRQQGGTQVKITLPQTLF